MDRPTETRAARRAGVMLPLAMLLFAFFSYRRQHTGRVALFLTIAAVVSGLNFLAPGVWLAVFRAWMRASRALGAVLTKLFLLLSFVFVVTPLGLLRHLIRRAPLDTAWKDGRPSYWIEKTDAPATIERHRKSY